MPSQTVELAYDEQGTGRPVLLIHGFPLCRRMWQPQLGPLAGAGYRVIAPDLRGFGETPPERFPVSMDVYADDLVALLDRLGIAQVVAGGMSMGGYVLMNLLERYPQRISAAMFLVTRAAADDPAARTRRQQLADETLSSGPQKVADAFESLLFAPETPRQAPELVSQVREWMLATRPGGIAAGLLAMKQRRDYIDRLSSFDLPALVVGADQDLAVPLGHSVILSRGLPQARLQVIEGAGHMANLEQPDAFNRCLLDFLDALPPA